MEEGAGGGGDADGCSNKCDEYCSYSPSDGLVFFTAHRSQVIVLPIQEVSQTYIKANLRPENFCLGLIRPKVSFYECLRYFLHR